MFYHNVRYNFAALTSLLKRLRTGQEIKDAASVSTQKICFQKTITCWFVGGLFGVCGVFLLFLLRFFLTFSFGNSKLGLRLIFFVFCYVFAFLFAKLLLIILKIVGVVFFRLGAFYNVFGPRLLLFRLPK